MSDVKENPRLLIISPYFVPRKRVGALRSYKFAKFLNKMGWKLDVVFLHANQQKLSKDESDHLSGIDLHALEVPFDRTTKQSGSDLTKASLHSPTQNKKQKGSSLFQGFVDYLERFIPMDTWFPLLRYHYSKVEQIILKQKPQAIWVTADPWSGLLLASRMAKVFNLPLIVDFRDPFTLCPVRSKRKVKWVQNIEQYWERTIFEQAKAIVFTAKDTLFIYQNHYPGLKDKMALIHNSYDLDIHRNSMDQNTSKISSLLPVPSAEQTFKLVFLGKFRSSSPIESVIKLFERIRVRYPDLFTYLRLYHIGALSRDVSNRIKTLQLEELFMPMHAVPYNEVPKMLADFQVLLSILNPNRDMVIPSKFWDYLPAQAPIISIGGNAEMADILSNTKRGKQFKASELDQLATYIYHLWQEWSGNNKQTDMDEQNRVDVINIEETVDVQDPEHPLYAYSALSKTHELSTLLFKAIEQHSMDSNTNKS